MEQQEGKDHVWVIIETKGIEERFWGIQDKDGDSFIPCTKEQFQSQMLMAKLPEEDGLKRQAEAIHKVQLSKEAASQGYSVYLVNEKGEILEKWPPDSTH